jgi:hypothetical protein
LELLTLPLIISFNKIEVAGKGSLIVGESEKEIPFPIKRVYWVEGALNELEVRGNHAHKTSIQVVVAMKGAVRIELESKEGETFSFHLASSDEGLLIPPMYWRKLFLEKNGSCLCFASKEYSEEDYIREYSVFKQ